MLKTKLYQNTGVTISDDLPKVASWFKRHLNLPVTFDIEGTKVSKEQSGSKLFIPNDGKYDVVTYVFDRANQSGNSLCFLPTPNLIGIWLSTSKADDATDYTWKSLVHEILHALFYKFKIPHLDCMDVTYIKGVPYPYYRNEEPENPDSNYGEAVRRLSPYMHLIVETCLQGELYDRYTGKKCPLKAATSPSTSISLAKWGMLPTLEKKASQLLMDAKKAGFNIKITHGYRDPTYQDKLYAQGRTLPGKIVTNATGKTSKHCQRKAFDIAFTGSDPYPKNANWKAIGQLGKNIGLVWGGDFKSFKDLLHFEI